MKVLAFNKWDCSEIKVHDPGLKNYINVNPVIVPKTGARYAGNKFHKSKLFIMERLINKVMIPGHKAKKHKISSSLLTGKAITAYKIVENTLKLVESRTKHNPIEVFVAALENAAPREEIITIEYGGARYPKAIEMAPQRRVDQVMKYMTQGAYQKSFNSKKKIESCLAEEIIAAYNLAPTSVAISKKLELERQADASR
ncbi:MAG: 30S ribosomal protein S7 [Nanoarchaeota archaeon]|nr:30S ribosomal protein S7 [Nanoarchaeota archaeon]